MFCCFMHKHSLCFSPAVLLLLLLLVLGEEFPHPISLIGVYKSSEEEEGKNKRMREKKNQRIT